jgi:hypothetical protein
VLMPKRTAERIADSNGIALILGFRDYIPPGERTTIA